jgi:hypothetical protein
MRDETIGEAAAAAREAEENEERILEGLGHPKGTLAVVGVYMALFVAGWILFYYFLFLPRGAPQL